VPDWPALRGFVEHVLTKIERPTLRRLYELWKARRGGRLFPARADFSPHDFAFALGNLSLIDVLRDPLRFRVRLQGSHSSARLGWDITGRFFDEIPDPEYRAVTLETYERIVEDRRPRCEVRELLFDNRSHRYEILWLPLAADGSTIDMIMACVALFDGPHG
jgi:hypothetical protein